jgi:predicted TIM-barrel fold metal-dependent hydrolase
LWTAYRPLIDAHKTAAARQGAAAARAILHDTAARVYRI